MKLSCTTSSSGVLILVLLTGCFSQPVVYEAPNDAPSYLIPALVEGRYSSNPQNTEILELSTYARFETTKGTFTKPYHIDDHHVVIKMRNSDLEVRPDLTLSITNNGQTLVCPSCAKYGLSNRWTRATSNLPRHSITTQ